jgi:hypothetical protein
MAATKNCIICFEKATGFGGHVHFEKEKIIAGFCNAHVNSIKTNPIETCKGCYGEWKEEMGKDESFGQLMYIDKDGIHPADEDKK